MKTILCLTMLVSGCFAQTPVGTLTSVTPTNVIGGGIFYNQYSTPNVSGWLGYGVKVVNGTYSYTEVDITSVKIKPFMAQTSSTTGIAQYIKTIGKIDVYGLAGAGASVAGGNVGGAFTGGALLATKIKGGWGIQVPVKVIKSSLSPTQYVVGLGVSWGK